MHAARLFNTVNDSRVLFMSNDRRIRLLLSLK